VPTQALFFLNDPLVHNAADAWARHLQTTSADHAGQIRAAMFAALGREADEAALAAAGRFLDAYRKEFVDGEEIELTALEFRLLTTLHDRKNRVQTRARLLDDVWGIQSDITTRTVDTHIKRLREKLGAAGDGSGSAARGANT
jgi:DNA-binding response OmpR family regulator